MTESHKLAIILLGVAAAFCSASAHANVLFSDNFNRSTTLNNGVNFTPSNPDPGPWSNSTLNSDGSDGALSAAASNGGSGAGFRLQLDGAGEKHRISWAPTGGSEPTINNAAQYAMDIRFHDTATTGYYDLFYFNHTTGGVVTLRRFANNTIVIRAEEDGSTTGYYFGSTSTTNDVWYRIQVTHNASEGKINFKVTNLDTDTVMTDENWSGNISQQTTISLANIGQNFASNSNVSGYADIDNFSITEIPEPSSMGLLLSGVAACMVRNRRLHE